MIFYKATGDSWRKRFITKIEVSRETDKCVFLEDGRRANKLSDYECYFPTFQEAQEYLKKIQWHKIAQLNQSLVKERETLDKILAETDE